jgi:hypothetical protein
LTQTLSEDISPFGYSRKEVDNWAAQLIEDTLMFASFLTTNEVGLFECVIDGDIHLSVEVLRLTGKKT